MRDRLHILHLTTFLQGGAGRAIADLACAQHADGHRVTVVTSLTPKGEFGNYSEYLERLRAAGVTLHTCDSLFARDLDLNLQVVRMLSGSIETTSLDVIHAHAAVPAFIGQLYAERARAPIPVVQTQHGWGINKTAEQAAFDLEILRRVDGVITTSYATSNLLVRFGTAPGAITIIPCGLSARAKSQPGAQAVRALQPLRDAGRRVLGCIGSVTANKNQRLLLDAFECMDANVGVVFIGEGSEALAEEARIRNLEDRVLAVGYQPDAAQWLPLFDLLVVPSRTEGQGLVILEAFRAGVPVAASDIPALVELIEDGRSGFLFTEGNPHALAAAVQRVFALSRLEHAALTNAARQRFAADFTVDQMVARHERLYRDLIAEEVGIAV